MDELSESVAILRSIGRDPDDVVSNEPLGFLSAQTLKGNELGRNVFRTPAEIAASGFAEVEWLAQGLVARGNITDIVGKVKTAGKTTFLLSLIAAIQRGGQFIGGQCSPCPVVLLSEQADSSLIEALRRAGLMDAADLFVAQWHSFRKTPWPSVVAMACEQALRIGAGVLAVDTLGRWAEVPGDSENSAGAAAMAMEPLRLAAAEAGLAVITVRHGRKSGGDVGDDGRGSSAFAGEADILLSLRRPEGNHSRRPNVRELQGVGRLDGIPESILIELQGDTYVLLGDEPAVAHHEAIEMVKGLLPPAPEHAIELSAFQNMSSLPRTTVQRALQDLIEQGTAQRVGKGRRGDPHRYCMSEKVSAQTSDSGWAESIPEEEGDP